MTLADVSLVGLLGTALLAIWGLGWLGLRLTAPAVALSRLERGALSFLVGTVLLSAVSWWMSGTVAGIPVRWLLLAAMLGGSALVVVRAASGRAVAREDRRPGRAERYVSLACATGLGLFCLVTLLVALATPLGWDGLFNFELKARIAFLEGAIGRVPASYVTDASRAWTHPHYPLLIPQMEGWVYGWIGAANQWAVKPLFACFFFSLLGVFYGTVRRAGSQAWALAGCLLLALVPAFTVGPGEATSGYADVPLAAFLLGSVVHARRALDAHADRRLPAGAWRQHAWIAGLLAGGAAWTKREGVLLAALFAVSLVAVWLIGQGWRAGRGWAHHERWPATAAWLVAGPALMAGLWYLIPVGDSNVPADLVALTPANLVAHGDRVPEVTRLLGAELLRGGRWAAVWPAFGVLTVLSARHLGRFEMAVTLTLLAAAASYVGVFTLSAWPDYAAHVGTALPRLLLPLAPLAWLTTWGELRRHLSTPA